MDPRDGSSDDSARESKPELRSSPAGNRALGFIGLGFQFAITLLLCVWLGKFADDSWHTRPLFVLIGLFLGLGSATWQLLKQVQRDARREEKKR